MLRTRSQPHQIHSYSTICIPILQVCVCVCVNVWSIACSAFKRNASSPYNHHHFIWSILHVRTIVGVLCLCRDCVLAQMHERCTILLVLSIYICCLMCCSISEHSQSATVIQARLPLHAATSPRGCCCVGSSLIVVGSFGRPSIQPEHAACLCWCCCMYSRCNSPQSNTTICCGNTEHRTHTQKHTRTRCMNRVDGEWRCGCRTACGMLICCTYMRTQWVCSVGRWYSEQIVLCTDWDKTCVRQTENRLLYATCENVDNRRFIEFYPFLLWLCHNYFVMKSAWLTLTGLHSLKSLCCTQHTYLANMSNMIGIVHRAQAINARFNRLARIL